jgi:hypothetical protein
MVKSFIRNIKIGNGISPFCLWTKCYQSQLGLLENTWCFLFSLFCCLFFFFSFFSFSFLQYWGLNSRSVLTMHWLYHMSHAPLASLPYFFLLGFQSLSPFLLPFLSPSFLFLLPPFLPPSLCFLFPRPYHSVWHVTNFLLQMIILYLLLPA